MLVKEMRVEVLGEGKLSYNFVKPIPPVDQFMTSSATEGSEEANGECEHEVL